MLNYAPLQLRVSTPKIELLAATDELLDELSEVVRAGKASAEPAPYDDPISLYEEDPDARVRKWLQAIWRGRGTVTADFWRLYFVVTIEGRPVGMQDLIGENFNDFRSATSFSWLSSDAREQGIGTEMRQAVLQLAFDGFDASEARSDAFIDNTGSNRVSRKLGYTDNGIDWATRRGEAAALQRWRLTREAWLSHRRDDIELYGVSECKAAFGIDSASN